ncbi:MAG: nucleotide exchange factor GrpE [Actinomycetota bacterium]
MDTPSGSSEERKVRVTVRDRRKVRHDEEPVTAPSGGEVASEESPSPDPAAVAGIEDELSRARSEAATYLDDLKRLKAEFDNYRKRILKEQTILAERAAAGLVVRLLPVLDTFELAVAAAEESRDFDRMVKGVEMVFGELKEVLAAEGLGAIDAKDHPFDPNLHEAALEVPGDPDGEPFVAEVLRTGYLFKSRVLRPSMVKVTRKGSASPPPDPGGEESG